MAAGDVYDVLPSAARTADGTSGAVPTSGADQIGVLVNSTVSGGADSTLIVHVQWATHPNGPWLTADPAEGTTQLTAPGSRARVVQVRAPYYRIFYDVGGTTPSVTFNVQTYHT